MPYPLPDLSGLAEAIRLKGELLCDVARSAPAEWPDLVSRFVERLDASGLQDTTALLVLLADLCADIQSLMASDMRLSRAADLSFSLEHWRPASRGEVLRLFRDELVQSACAIGGRAGTASPVVRAAARFIDEHFAERVTLDLLASALQRSKRYVAARFRHDTGRTVHAYLTHVRLRHALELIRSGEKIEAVSLLVGYRSKKNFYRHFKEVIGATPLAYKLGRGAGTHRSPEAGRHN